VQTLLDALPDDATFIEYATYKREMPLWLSERMETIAEARTGKPRRPRRQPVVEAEQEEMRLGPVGVIIGRPGEPTIIRAAERPDLPLPVLKSVTA
jgi:hypothetical protein